MWWAFQNPGKIFCTRVTAADMDMCFTESRKAAIAGRKVWRKVYIGTTIYQMYAIVFTLGSYSCIHETVVASIEGLFSLTKPRVGNYPRTSETKCPRVRN